MSDRNLQGRTNLLFGILLVGLGALFLLGQIFGFNLAGYLWPFFIIVPGLLFFLGMVLGGKPAGPLAIPGSIVTTVGLLLLYQSITGHWESWAYAWTLIFPTSVGVGLTINGIWSDIPDLKETGSRWITAGVVIFLMGGIFFELILNVSGGLIGNILWPGMLILLGIYLLARRASPDGGSHDVEKVVHPPVAEQPSQQVPDVEFTPLGEEKKETFNE